MPKDNTESREPPCYFDPKEERLWLDQQEIPLTPKTLAMLRYLLAHPQRLLSKELLLENVWPNTYVNDSEVRHYIAQLRGLLNDDPQNPRFIETVHGRGYRFIGKIHPRLPPNPDQATARANPVFSSVPLYSPNSIALSARQTELAQLQQWLAQAETGSRQIGFITGELGIGKTTLVKTFLATLSNPAAYWIGCGQCVENQDAEEAYMPVLDVLQHLCHGQDGDLVCATLNGYAPSWLLQIPELLNTGSIDLDDLQRRTQGSSRTRMLRELSHALEAICQQRSLILWLEDLHWADAATLDLLAYIARRIEPARLLVLCTYRSMDVAGSVSALRGLQAELELSRLCRDLNLLPLNEKDIVAFLAQHLPGLPAALAPLLHQHNAGNPLFLANMLEHLSANNAIMQTSQGWQLQHSLSEIELGLPESLRHLLEQRLARLTAADQQLLEVASVAGVSFSTAVLAARLEQSVESIEKRCDSLAQQSLFLHRVGTSDWPDGTLAARYEFIHTLYQTTLYERVTPARRASIHQTIARRLEQAYTGHSETVAADLAYHFEQSRDYDRAAAYLYQVAQIDLRRYAHQTAAGHLRKAQKLLASQPPSAILTHQALEVQLSLATALFADEGYAGPTVGAAYAQAYDLCRQLGDNESLLHVLVGQRTFHFVRAELASAQKIAGELLALAQQTSNPTVWLQAHRALGTTLLYRGDLHQALSQLERGAALYRSQAQANHEFDQNGNPSASCLCHAAHACWLLGQPQQALEYAAEALHIAHKLGHPDSLCPALGLTARLYQLMRDPKTTLTHAESVIELATEYEFPFWRIWGETLQDWALAEVGQIEHGQGLLQNRLAFQANHAALAIPEFMGLLAQRQALSGEPGQGLVTLREALTLSYDSGAHYHLAELHRLEGELRLQYRPQRVDEAEACLQKALAMARDQGAKAWQLRSATSLARLRQKQGNSRLAYVLLAPILNEFSEGFDTPDVEDASQLLAQLAPS